jgi:hypothetical protein
MQAGERELILEQLSRIDLENLFEKNQIAGELAR